MSCTRRGFLKTIGAAMVGLGLTRLEPLRTYASSSTGFSANPELGGPPAGPFAINALRLRAVEAARQAGDSTLAGRLQDVCCWAPAATAIRERPLDLQRNGAGIFFKEFPGGDQLADVLFHANNTSWQRPLFRYDPEALVAKHYELLDKSASDIRTVVVTPQHANGHTKGDLGLMLDRETGERLAKAADRAEPMWAALSVFSGVLLDPTSDLSRRLAPSLSLHRADDRALARLATVRYAQVVLGAVQRAVYSDVLGGANPTLPLVHLTASGFLPLGEDGGRFYLLRIAGAGSYLTGYRSASA